MKPRHRPTAKRQLPACVQITEELKEAAGAIFDCYEVLFPEGGWWLGRLPELWPVTLKFDTPEHTDRGEHLVCEIIAKIYKRRSYSSDDFPDVPRGDESWANLEIEPLVYYVEKLGQTLKPGSEEHNRQKSLQKRIAQKQAEFLDVHGEFLGLVEGQSTGKRLSWFIRLQFIWDDVFDLQSEAFRLADECVHSQNISLNLPQVWTRSPEIHHVEYLDSRSFEVPFETFLTHKLMDLCRTVASINHPGVQFAPDVEIIELMSKFDELFHRCGLLSYQIEDFPDYPNPIPNAQAFLEHLMKAEWKFSKYFFTAPQKTSVTSSSVTSGSDAQLVPTEPRSLVPVNSPSIKVLYEIEVLDGMKVSINDQLIEQNSNPWHLLLCVAAARDDVSGSFSKYNVIKKYYRDPGNDTSNDFYRLWTNMQKDLHNALRKDFTELKYSGKSGLCAIPTANWVVSPTIADIDGLLDRIKAPRHNKHTKKSR